MKWFLLIVLILLLVLFLSFGRALGSNNPSPPQITPGPTVTPTIGPSPTVDTLSPLLFSAFNVAIEDMIISTPINELEHIGGARYQVTGVDFLQEGNSPVILRIKTRCECAENGPCCNYIHTFIVTIMLLEKIYHSHLLQSLLTPTPGQVGVLQVWCYDHASLTKVVSVPWMEVIGFLDGQIDGFQLWAKVTPEP